MTGAHIHGHQLERVSKFHYLGVLFDENLTWKEQVGDIAFKASKRLGLMARIRFCFTKTSTKCIFNTLVKTTSGLYSCRLHDAAWRELSEGCKNDLQRIQN